MMECLQRQALINLPLLAFILASASSPPQAAMAQQRYVVLIGGLGGEPAYVEKFERYLFEAREAFIGPMGVPADHITVLGETALKDRPYVDDVSLAENIQARFQALAARLRPEDHVYIVLFGHGSHDGTTARLNIPRRDLDANAFADLVAALPSERVVFVNTTSASGPFVEAISGERRIVITATRRGSQRNETQFPRFLIEALRSPDADLDKDGDLSVREVFVYASERTQQHYVDGGFLATEHAVLEDTGDGQGYRFDALDAQGEGLLAGVTFLKRGGVLATSGARAAPVTPAMAEGMERKAALEMAIAALKAQKSTLVEDQYYDRLEALFIQLARLNDQLEAAATRQQP